MVIFPVVSPIWLKAAHNKKSNEEKTERKKKQINKIANRSLKFIFGMFVNGSIP